MVLGDAQRASSGTGTTVMSTCDMSAGCVCACCACCARFPGGARRPATSLGREVRAATASLAIDATGRSLDPNKLNPAKVALMGTDRNDRGSCSAMVGGIAELFVGGTAAITRLVWQRLTSHCGACTAPSLLHQVASRPALAVAVAEYLLYHERDPAKSLEIAAEATRVTGYSQGRARKGFRDFSKRMSTEGLASGFTVSRVHGFSPAALANIPR